MWHQINESELADWIANKELLYASSSKDRKKLYVTMDGYYKVYYNGSLVYQTNVAGLAVKKYNEL